jgi:type IV pilus assembly protein PilV
VNPWSGITRRRTRGSALVEVLVSVLLFSIGIIALVRLLGTAVKDTGEIEYRAQAAALADEQVGRMWVDLGNLPGYAKGVEPLPELPGGTRTIEVDDDVVTVTIGWQAPGGPPRNHVVVATLAGN